MDLVPTLAKLYFSKSVVVPRAAISLSYTQAALLLGLGLQFKSIEDLQIDLNLQANQLLPLFNKGIRKFTRVFKEVFEREIGKELDKQSKGGVAALLPKSRGEQYAIKKSLADELNEGETQLTKKMKEEKQEFLKQISKHQIKAKDEDFDKALLEKSSKTPLTVISVQKQKRDNDEELEELEEKVSKKDKKDKKHKRQKHD